MFRTYTCLNYVVLLKYKEMTIKEVIDEIRCEIGSSVTLVAVSKTHPAKLIRQAYDAGVRDFGENKVQELQEKVSQLPADIRWHMIGHMQSNKVKFIAPFIYLIHGVDSLKLLKTIDKEGAKNCRVINCLIQIHIADEESKFGFSADDVEELMSSGVFEQLKNIKIRGLMGMATFTDDEAQVRREFAFLKSIFDRCKTLWFAGNDDFDTLSMGMSDDFPLALENGSTLIRVGSRIFGHREYNN